MLNFRALTFSFLGLSALLHGLNVVSATEVKIFVSPQGNDSNQGTLQAPLLSFETAQIAARKFAGKQPVTVSFADGIYYLPKTVVFTHADSGTVEAPVVYQAATERGAILSGGVQLKLAWKPYKDGILQAQVPADLETEEIFINGERQILARYPNFDASAKYFNGYAPDALSPERASRWADPTGGYFHVMHDCLWGGFTYRITRKDAKGAIATEGGWQNNRGTKMHPEIRFVENIFEELDSPGEWFLNRKTHTLYFYPPHGLDLSSATVEAVRLHSLVEFSGNQEKPVRFVNLRGFTFRHAARTVMDTKEGLLRTDWAIYRGGALFINGAEDCTLQDSLIDQVGGNAVFVNAYNRRITVRGCEIRKAGASGISFIGSQDAVRRIKPIYKWTPKFEELDLTPGPLTPDYPADSLVDDCLIYLTGRVEKQTAGVEIDIAQNITVRHCSIYDMPRAGINIGDGCFGGNLVEFCDVFDTVKETGDHGSFNAWGRDRFWMPGNLMNEWVNQHPEMPSLDMPKPNTLRNNRWRCEHGWDMDLDDGSSNYLITNNLFLNGGLKLREGYHRTVENNVILGGLHMHCWTAESHDVVQRNILLGDYLPCQMPQKWVATFDYNLRHKALEITSPAATLQKWSNQDEHSLLADAQLIDPAKGDFRVKDGSPALSLGFVNFPMDQFGVQKPSFKAIARIPSFEKAKPEKIQRNASVQTWLQARVRNLVGQGEMSVYGTPGENGIIVQEVSAGTALAEAGLQKNDVILSINDKTTNEFVQLFRISSDLKPGAEIKIGILRLQKSMTLTAKIPTDSQKPFVP